MNPSQFARLIIRPTLQGIGLWSIDAERLLLGTALTESKLEYVHQIGGPALGVYQCEKATHDDIWTNYLNNLRAPKDLLPKQIKGLLNSHHPHENLVYNLAYATAICRVHYLRSPKPMPSDALSMAFTWKLLYNSNKGKGTVEKALPFFKQSYEVCNV